MLWRIIKSNKKNNFLKSTIMQIIEKITFKRVVDLVFNAKKFIYLSLPGIDIVTADVLIEKLNKNPIKIKVLIDNSEETIRNGYGDIEGIEKLFKNNIEIYQSDGNLISFLIADDIGYFIFPQSKIFENEPKGTNAFRLDPISMHMIINHFFENNNNNYGDDELPATINKSYDYFKTALNECIYISDDVLPFDKKEFSVIKENLSINPPLPPNLKRLITTYTSKIQFIDFKFNGGNLEKKIINLPVTAIPISSIELKKLLKTKINMFNDVNENPGFKKLNELKKNVENLRKEYLIPITCRPGKNIIKIPEKNNFIDKLKSIKEEIKNLDESLYSLLEEQMLNTKDLLRVELKIYFSNSNNETPDLKRLPNGETKDKKLKETIDKIIYSIKFPEVKSILDKIIISEIYYDLTWNDFSDDKLLKEFKEKNILKEDINSIIELKNAFVTKKI